MNASESLREMSRKSSDPKVRFVQAVDDRSMGRDLTWAKSDSDPKVAAVASRADREVTARQLGVVSFHREESTSDDDDEGNGRRPRRRQEKHDRRNRDDYED